MKQHSARAGFRIAFVRKRMNRALYRVSLLVNTNGFNTTYPNDVFRIFAGHPVRTIWCVIFLAAVHFTTAHGVRAPRHLHTSIIHYVRVISSRKDGLVCCQNIKTIYGGRRSSERARVQWWRIEMTLGRHGYNNIKYIRTDTWGWRITMRLKSPGDDIYTLWECDDRRFHVYTYIIKALHGLRGMCALRVGNI